MFTVQASSPADWLTKLCDLLDEIVNLSLRRFAPDVQPSLCSVARSLSLELRAVRMRIHAQRKHAARERDLPTQ
jgi:hypothetical protein